MKYVLFTILSTFSAFALSATSESLFSVSSKDREITEFDFVVTEIERQDGVSTLKIPNFQERSSQASRWMMCIYTELAISRNAEYWSSIYTDDSGDIVTIVLPESNSLEDPAFSDIDLLGTQPRVTPVAVFKRFCGLN